MVLSLDKKSQIQALDRTHPGLPIKPGRCQTTTHDYKCHGTTTLFASPSVLDGTDNCTRPFGYKPHMNKFWLFWLTSTVAAAIYVALAVRQVGSPQASGSNKTAD